MAEAETGDRVFENDGWDTRFRIGLLVPDGDVGPESEWSAMLPPGVAINVSRFEFPTLPVKQGPYKITTEPVDFVAAPGPLDSAVKILASANSLDIIALGFTSNSYVSDDECLVKRLTEKSRGRPVVTTGQAFLAAIAALDAKNVMLVDPPWFPPELTQRGQEWLENKGTTVAWSGMADIPSGQANVHPTGLYRWLRKNIAPGTDLILTGGNGFRTVGVVRAVEADIGIPMVTANSALLWHSLNNLGYPASAVTRYGCLFRR